MVTELESLANLAFYPSLMIIAKSGLKIVAKEVYYFRIAIFYSLKFLVKITDFHKAQKARKKLWLTSEVLPC